MSSTIEEKTGADAEARRLDDARQAFLAAQSALERARTELMRLHKLAPRA